MTNVSVAAYDDYEVFLSFRGPDTRKGFTDHLYNNLTGAGIRVFLDDEDLRVGEEIGGDLFKAITQSKICIPIFSTGYASSKWCLMEVVHMVKCEKTQLIMPIFYDVTPHQVRHQTGTYKEAFEQHLQHCGEETVRDWRNALAKIGALEGLELQGVAKGHEGKLVNLVVSEVLKELKKPHLVVSDYETGVQDRAEEVIRRLKVGSDDVRMVVLYGIPGIGKTTLAKVIYNQLSEHFECCSFLKDIREMSLQTKGLEKLQTQLVNDLLKTKNAQSEFASIDDGIKVLRERLRGKKVLILLDDVDQRDQMNALAAKGSWFGQGSRIIITSRNTKGLDESQLAETYEVQELHQEEALVLFCKHAFKSDSPVDEFVDLSKGIVSRTGGLPLALEVIGSFLCGRPKIVWEETYEKLQKEPFEEVEDKLMISYHALKPEEKEIFLDIACFFIGADWNIAAHMWKHFELFPATGIEVLRTRSLIKLRDGNKIWMHDQLRDLGRKIVRLENPKEPGKRSRLWHSKEARDVLVSQKGTEKIEAMSLDYGYGVEGKNFESKHFINLSKLRYLRLSNVDIVGHSDPHLFELRWLHWDYCPVGFQASGLCLDNLLVLELSESHITNDDWGGWGSMKRAKELKALILRSCWCLTKTPDLSVFPALEMLNLDNCEGLCSVDPSIKSLEKLSFLSIKNCSRLTELPHALSCLQALVELHIDGSGVRQLPTLEGLKNLEVFTANRCMHLSHISESISHLTSLLELSLDESGVRTISDSIGALVKLKRLSLRNCESLRELPNSIGKLTSLEKLCLSGASVHNLPDSIGELTNLQELLVDQTRITKLPRKLEMLDKLELLDASVCPSLSDIETLCPLTTLKLNHTNIEMLPRSISKNSGLETLDLIECHALRTLPRLPNSLLSLSVTCRPIVKFPNLFNSKILTELRLLSCSKFKKIPGLGSLKFLRTLMVSECRELAKLDGLEKLESLTKLRVEYCRYLQSLPNLSALKKLRHLNFVECEKLNLVEGLGELESLEHLKIQGCESIAILPDLSKLRKLKELVLVNCEKLREIQGLEGLESLKRVDIGYSPSLHHYTEEWPYIPWDDLPRTVEIESHMKEVMKLLEIDASDVRRVVILGHRGVGKTTLAKIIYDQLSEHFAYHSFISNIQETSQKTSDEKLGLKKLQGHLLSDMLRPVNPKKFEFTSVDEGIDVINQRLKGKRVLIVLDGVDQRNQLNALVPNEDLFAPGSRILITTTNRAVLDVNQATGIYKLNKLQFKQASLLFCKHAFRKDIPPLAFKNMFYEMAWSIGELPLALEVIGSFLYKKDERVWDCMLKNLSSRPSEDEGYKLKLCYDTLSPNEKQIFLDIACFLSGTDKRIAIPMWEDCGFSPIEALQVLHSMSLVNVGNDNILWMQDRLRDLGREIVEGESYCEPGRRSRLWQTQVTRGVLNDQQGTGIIEAICLDYGNGSEESCVTSEQFRLLPNLRFLQLNKANIAGDFNSLLSKLRWLHWHHCPIKIKATNLCLKKLVILDLSESNITDDWNGWRFMQTATNLKVLILRSCRKLAKTPDFSSFSMLERLHLDDCTSLNYLNPSIVGLQKLVFLSVKGCTKLQALPRELSSRKVEIIC